MTAKQMTPKVNDKKSQESRPETKDLRLDNQGT
jgi:hypothetical protein